MGFVIFKTFIHPANIVDEPLKWLNWDPAPGYTLKYFINHPLDLLTIIRTTLYDRGDWYIFHMIGSPMGWLDLRVPNIYIIILGILLVLSIFVKSDEPDILSPFLRICLSVLAVVTIIFINIGMAISWTRAGIPMVEGLQGRYFIPVVFPLLISFRGKSITATGKMNNTIIAAEFLILMILSHLLMIRLL